MSLSVCASSTNTDLTTLANVKAMLNITGPAQDPFLQRLLHSASRWAENYIGRGMLTVQSYAETKAGYGRRQMMLRHTPLRAIDRILDGTDSGSATEILSSEFMAEDRAAGILERPQGWGWTPTFMGRQFDSAFPLEFTPLSGQEEKPWLVGYRAGWTLGGISTDSPNWSTQKGSTSTGRTLPEDVELAVLFRTQAFYTGGDEAQSESLDDLSVNYRTLGTDKDGMLITRAKDLLMSYQGFI